MAKAMLPNWPGAMSRRTAAAYCDMTPAQFEGEVAAQRMPMPILMAGQDRWQRAALDRALDQLAGGADATDWRATAKLYAQG